MFRWPQPTPVQTWVNGRFTPVEQPPVQPAVQGLNDSAAIILPVRFELAPRALFQDLFNAELGAQGICGGYGIFDPALGFRAIAMSSTSRSQSFKERRPVSSKAAPRTFG